MIALVIVALSAQAGGAQANAAFGPSPCAGRYDAWVADESVFVRTDQPPHMQGLHVACVWRNGTLAESELHLEAYLNGVYGTQPLLSTLPAAATAGWREFRKELRLVLGFQKKTNEWGHLQYKQPFGVFAESGKRLASVGDALDAGLVLVVEGGQWFWPPIRPGFLRDLPEKGLQLETLSVQPVIYRVKGFLQEEECDEIVKLGQGRMVNSPVSLMDKDRGKAAKEFRTSTQARVPSSESRTLAEIDQRISRLTHIPVQHNEEVQILRYEKTQYYSAHLDNWDPAYYSGKDTSFMEHGHNNRLITVFWYLTNVSEGGETLFPRADGLPQPMDMYSCDAGLKVKPELGNVIFWYSLHPNGNTDPNGLHAACPVKVGEKWSANYWVWNKPRSQRAVAMPDESVDKELNEPAAPSGGGKVSATFRNWHPSQPAYLFWFRPQDGKEVPMGVIAAGGQSTMNTFQGHLWNMRAGPTASSRQLKTFAMTGEAVQVHDGPRAKTQDQDL